MAEVDYTQLQEEYGGQYVARRSGEMIASAHTYDDLSIQLDNMAVEWNDIIIEYVEPTSSINVY